MPPAGLDNVTHIAGKITTAFKIIISKVFACIKPFQRLLEINS